MGDLQAIFNASEPVEIFSGEVARWSNLFERLKACFPNGHAVGEGKNCDWTEGNSKTALGNADNTTALRKPCTYLRVQSRPCSRGAQRNRLVNAQTRRVGISAISTSCSSQPSLQTTILGIISTYGACGLETGLTSASGRMQGSGWRCCNAPTSMAPPSHPAGPETTNKHSGDNNT